MAGSFRDYLTSIAGTASSATGGITGSMFGIDLATLQSVFKDFANLPGAINALEKLSSEINENFILGRSRVLEFKSTIATVSPIVRQLGGDVENVVNMIKESSAALNRVVVFDKDVYTDIFTLTQLLDTDTKTIVTNFSNVGISIANVTKDVQNSIKYVKSIGMDAKAVMTDVVNNADLLNRFNFKEGVLGFSKMAATAAILKADMGDIKSFADKVFNVEGAIETASALQRLGIFMGDLADPFTLMNKSLNDPEGLIKSIGRAVEQFTTLDIETGKISINPSAIGMFKELGTQLGYDDEKLKKIAINMREFNERASQIDFKFNLSEEQEMLIANLAYLNEKGDYVVTIKDEKTGEMVAKKVSELTEPQINKLKEISEKEPETLIELTKQSMSTGNLILNNLIAIKYRLLFGGAGTPTLLDYQEKNREFVKTTLLESIDNLFSQQDLIKLRTDLETIAPQLDPKNPLDAMSKIAELESVRNIINNFSELSTVLESLIPTVSDYNELLDRNIRENSTSDGSLLNPSLTSLFNRSVTPFSPMGRGSRITPLNLDPINDYNRLASLNSSNPKFTIEFIQKVLDSSGRTKKRYKIDEDSYFFNSQKKFKSILIPEKDTGTLT